ncbi:MAG: hypothetical protein MI919_26055, partial [Holophagales bacterium]|nr:hypothetical protein [Holophagales bacterium]
MLQRARALGHRPEVYLELTPSARRGALRPAPRPEPESGDLVQAVLTARAELDDFERITAVRISGRPKGRFPGGAQGSHTTAFGLFRDVLESATLGRSVEEAYGNVGRLIEDLSQYPGYPDYEGDRPTGRPTHESPDELTVQDLGQLMVDYIEARDRLEYSAAFLGPGVAKGKGEAAALKGLRELENREVKLNDTELEQAGDWIRKLYDSSAALQRAMDIVGGSADFAESIGYPRLFGCARDYHRSRAEKQHLMTVFQAFPKVYNQLVAGDRYFGFARRFPSFTGSISQENPLPGYARATERDLLLDLGVTASGSGQSGYEITIAERPAGPFSQGPLRVFVLDLDKGVLLADPLRPGLVGRRVREMIDSKGRAYYRAMEEIA